MCVKSLFIDTSRKDGYQVVRQKFKSKFLMSYWHPKYISYRNPVCTLQVLQKIDSLTYFFCIILSIDLIVKYTSCLLL